MTRFAVSLFAAVTLAVAATAPAQPNCGGFRVLVFSKTAGFRHGPQIAAGQALIATLGQTHAFAVDMTEDANAFTPSNLQRYAVVVFLNTTGDVLDATQESAFEAYSRAGGGYVGIHSAADTEYSWPFYGQLMGAWFLNHPAPQAADVVVADANHPATAHLPARFSHNDEWYNYRTNPATNPNIRVLLTLDESTYSGGSMGAVHPIAWSQAPATGGRAFYTGLGHTIDTYAQPFFQQHLLGGILFAAGGLRTPAITGFTPYGAASGSPALALAGRFPTANTAELALSGAGAGRPGLLAVSTCDAMQALPAFTVLVDLAPTRLVGIAPITFDSGGASAIPLPLRVPLPALYGTTLFVQGAQLYPTIGASNGLRVDLTP